jgi:hypothetical protein
VYKLLAKYEYDVVLARLPVIIEPVALIREGVFVVLARIARFETLFVAAWLRAVTPRDAAGVVVAFIERTGILPREVTVLFATLPRDVVVLDAPCAVCAAVARETVVRAVFTRLLAVARGLVRPLRCGNVFAGAIGSANTERIDINVEHTKNAAANKNTVPIAFLQEFAFIRNVIIFSCYIYTQKRPDFRLFYAKSSFT